MGALRKAALSFDCVKRCSILPFSSVNQSSPRVQHSIWTRISSSSDTSRSHMPAKLQLKCTYTEYEYVDELSCTQCWVSGPHNHAAAGVSLRCLQCHYLYLDNEVEDKSLNARRNNPEPVVRILAQFDVVNHGPSSSTDTVIRSCICVRAWLYCNLNSHVTSLTL